MDERQFGLISIIMAAYNAEKTIGDAIESVLSQTYECFELLVVNDCSTDGTQKIVEAISERDGRVKIINNPQNCGVSVTRQNGLRACRGQWIAILDSDDLWLPDKLKKQIELQKRTNADLIYTGLSFIDQHNNSFDWIQHIPASVNFNELLKQNVISNCASLVRKELYEKYYAIGDEMHEDYAVWLGILKDGYNAVGIDEPLITVRISKNSKSGNKLKSAIMNWKTYRYIGLDIFRSAYYMIFYAVNGILKYKNLK